MANINDDCIKPKEQLEALLNDANLPTLPAVACRLIELTDNANANFADFAEVIESDMGLSSRLLRVANSAFYGLRTKATNLERAINALGLKYVRAIALGFHLVDTLDRLAPDGFDMNQFWQESLLRAVIARRLAIEFCTDLREEAFLVGLLQDCGVLILCQVYDKDYADLWCKAKCSPATLYDMEQDLFEMNHLDASAALCQRWNLPKLLTVPITNHHHPSQNQFSYDETVKLSQVAYFVGTLPLNDPEVLCPEDNTLIDFCSTAFGIERDQLTRILKQCSGEFSNVLQIFNKFITEPINISLLLNQASELLKRLGKDVPEEILNPEMHS